MPTSPSIEQPNQGLEDFDIASCLERVELALHQSALTDGKRILSIVALGLIRQHRSRDGAGDEARVQRTMTELFAEEAVTGRPRKHHEAVLLRMADMHVSDRANRDVWADRRKLGLEKGTRAPRIRGAEKLAEAAAFEAYGRTDDTIIKRLKEDFNEGRAKAISA